MAATIPPLTILAIDDRDLCACLDGLSGIIADAGAPHDLRIRAAALGSAPISLIVQWFDCTTTPGAIIVHNEPSQALLAILAEATRPVGAA